MNFSHFPAFKQNYPFYPFLIPKFILFSFLFWAIRLNFRQYLNFKKDRKRIKIPELVEYIVDLVFVEQVCPTLLSFTCLLSPWIYFRVLPESNKYAKLVRCWNEFSMTGWYGFSKPTIKFIISSDVKEHAVWLFCTHELTLWNPNPWAYIIFNLSFY